MGERGSYPLFACSDPSALALLDDSLLLFRICQLSPIPLARLKVPLNGPCKTNIFIMLVGTSDCKTQKARLLSSLTLPFIVPPVPIPSPSSSNLHAHHSIPFLSPLRSIPLQSLSLPHPPSNLHPSPIPFQSPPLSHPLPICTPLLSPSNLHTPTNLHSPFRSHPLDNPWTIEPIAISKHKCAHAVLLPHPL